MWDWVRKHPAPIQSDIEGIEMTSRNNTKKLCTIPACGNKHEAKGYCRKHYLRLYRYGDPLALTQPKDGRTRHPAHNTWHAMRQRCRDKNASNYQRYGGRGIKVCARWDDFQLFASDMGEKPSKKHSIERIDNGGDYTPENCKWATIKEQTRNRNTNRLLTIGGTTKCMTAWADVSGAKVGTVWYRLKHGWSDYDAVYGRNA